MAKCKKGLKETSNQIWRSVSIKIRCYNKNMKKILIIIVILILATIGYEYLKTKPTASPVQDLNLINQVTYACNEGQSIDASFYEGAAAVTPATDMPPTPTGKATVKLSDGREMTLNQTISASGVRYANEDESFVFWNKGNGALVLENNVEKSYIGCVEVSSVPAGSDLTQVYSSGSYGFSLRLPDAYKADESYVYDLAPGQKISGVKFTIPEALASGTNLSKDTYISVEELPQTESCDADTFLYGKQQTENQTTGDTTYSVASMTGAGAGNRYEETVYAIPGTNPCVALRYFIHYAVLENYPAGTVKEFDKDALISQFDQIRATLIINQ